MQTKKNIFQTIKNPIQYFLVALLSPLFICLSCLTLFYCALVWNPTLFFSTLVAFFGVFIDINMSFEYINQSLTMMFSRNYLRNEILESYLKENQASKFANFYRTLQKTLKSLLLQEHDLKHKGDQAQLKKIRADIEKYERELRRMQKLFKAFIYGKLKPAENNLVYEDINEQFGHHKEKILKAINIRILLNSFIFIVNLIAQTALAIFATAAIESSLFFVAKYFSFTIPALVLSSTVFGLAIVGGIVYCMFTYKATLDLLKNDMVKNIFKNFRDKILKRNENNSRYHWVRVAFFILLTALFVFVTVTATVATGGTWLGLAEAAKKIVPYVGSFMTWIRLIAIPFLATSIFIFYLRNSLRTVGRFANNFGIGSFLEKIYEFFYFYKGKNFLQCLNPFQAAILLINFLFHALIIVHFFSVSVIGDGLGKAFTAANFISEALNDWCFVFENKSKSADKNTDEDEHDHSHINILGYVLLAIYHVTLLAFLSALWNFACGKLNSDPHKKLSLSQAYWQIFETPDSKSEPESERVILISETAEAQNSRPEEPQIESSWAQLDLDYRIDKRIEASKISTDEKETLVQLKENLEMGELYNKNAKQYDPTLFNKSNLSKEAQKLSDEFFDIRNDLAYSSLAGPSSA